MFDVGSVYPAADIEDAIRALHENENSMIVSGGTDVWVANRDGKYAGSDFVSIHDIAELKGIRLEEDGTVVIGAGTCFTDITGHPVIQKYIPILGEAVDQVGSPQIRNVGTVGGNICNGVTSADSAPSLFALEALLLLRGPEGGRIVPISEFYTGPGKTVRARDEILCEIRIPKESYAGVSGQYIKYGKRNAMEISTLGCAVTVKLSPDKKIFERVRIAYGVAGPTPMRCPEAEKSAECQPVSHDTVAGMADRVLAAVNPRSSWRASREFRLHLTRVLLERAAEQAVIRAGGELL